MLVSAIMPVYNAEKVLMDSIKSILLQTWNDWELILIDDGSTDKSGMICDAFEAEDNRIRVIHTANGGVSNARNVGLSVAQGEWIIFVDSDDQLMPNAMDIMLRNSTDVDLVVYGYETMPMKKKTQYVTTERIYSHYLDTSVHFGVLYPKCFYNSVWNKMIRRQTITARFDTSMSLGEDLLFCMECMKNCDAIRVIPDILYRYRVTKAASLSRKNRVDAVEIQTKLKTLMDDAFQHNPSVTRITASVFGMVMIGSMQLLVYDENSAKTQKINTISQWINNPLYRESLESIKDRIRVDYLLVLQRSKSNDASGIYRIFAIKKQLSRILRKLRA